MVGLKKTELVWINPEIEGADGQRQERSHAAKCVRLDSEKHTETM